ncbi:MAG TPA: ATP-binding protein [Nitrospirales bacterium]|jgi:two-component system sensor histidine kinase KdpD
MLTTLFILTIVGILFYTIVTLHEQKSDALVVDMAGRQRMLNQRHVKELLLTAHGLPADYAYTRDVLNKTLDALTDGGLAVVTLGRDEKIQLPPAPTPALRAKLAEQKALIRDFTVKADEFLQLPISSPAYAPQLSRLLELNVRLQETANDAVKLFAEHSELKIATMIEWEAAIGLLVVVLGILLTRQVIQANRSLESEIAERKRAEEELRVSEARRIEAFRQSDSLKSALLSSVSHELRTPLTAIKTTVSSLLENFGTMAVGLRKEFLEGIDQEIDYLDRVVDNLLDMSRLEAGMVAPRCEWYLLEDLVEGAVRRVGPTLRARPLHCHLSEESAAVFVDGVEIQQVMVNLLDNAVKYSPAGSPIRIDARLTAREIEVRVSNHSEGIPPEDLERVFTRFYRVRTDRGRMIHGTGLGLTICKGIIEAHRGRIWAESTPGEQTTIAFTLPAPMPAAASDRPDPLSRPV